MRACSSSRRRSARRASRATRSAICATSACRTATSTAPTARLSGGQRKLVALAACLVLAPDVLLLDEPEAHLDVERRRIVEEIVGDFEGAVLVVSHDRYLLDETVSQIAELEHGRIRMWPGNYSAYAVAREVELIRQQQQWVTQQKEIARLEEAIRRFKDWAHRVVDERHIKRARNAQRRIDRMEKVDRPVFERRKMALALRSAGRGGDRVIELRGVDFDPVLIDVHLTIMRGERVGIVGPNGAGKTVLAKLLTGDLAPTEGERWAGPSIAVDFLTQTAEELPTDLTPIQIVRAAKPISEGEAVATLVKFLFDYEQLRRPIGTMSGGERTRLRCLLLDALAGELPRARRADEPPRHPGGRDARGGDRGLRRHGDRGQPRPLLPRPHRRPDRRGPRRRRARLRGRLQRVGAGPRGLGAATAQKTPPAADHSGGCRPRRCQDWRSSCSRRRS